MSDGPIDSFLHELRGRVPGGPLRRRRVLGELRAHLQDAAERELAAGRKREEAERLAVERFGVPFAGRPRRSATRIALVMVVAVVVAAAAVAVASRDTAGTPQALSPPVPYGSVPICRSAGWGASPAGPPARPVREGRVWLFVACRPQPAAAAHRIAFSAVGRRSDGARALTPSGRVAPAPSRH